MTDRLFSILSTGSMVINESLTPIAGPDKNRVDVIPFIKIDLNTDTDTRGRIQACARQKLIAVFTSANAVKAVTAVLQNPPDWKIYCVGSETKKSVASFFGEPAILDYAGNAEGLSEKIIQQRLLKEAVFFCGDQRRDLLPDKLRAHGIRLRELVVYQTKLTPMRVTKSYDAILFFSPTAVQSFFSLNTPSSKTILFALGETTAASIRSASDNEVRLCPKPDKRALLQMAVEYGQSHPIS